MLIVPETLNRNAACVRALGDPADTGLLLINYMCERIGIDSLADLDVLDFGCGVRFSQSIINRGVPVGTYTGVDVARNVIDFLASNVTDPRMSYIHVDTANPMYNCKGRKPDPDGPSPLADATFDVICMFSVITHQEPGESAAIFKLLRRHIRPAGWLFFSTFIHDDDEPFRELNPDRPRLRCSYSANLMQQILADAGWSVSSAAKPLPNGIPIASSYLCTPAP